MASPLTVVPNTRGVAIFDRIRGYISKTIIDSGIFTVEDKYKIVCVSSNGVTFDDLE